MKLFDAVHRSGFLWPAERNLMHHFMTLHQDAFAWNDTERGHFREDFFPPVEIPVVPHKPWIVKNRPIPPGIYHELCKLLQKKLDAGVLQKSCASYRGGWFAVVKKDGVSLRIVQSLEPLNAVTIAHSGVTPFTDQIAEQFSALACAGLLDLFVGYDERALAESSRDYTTFQTPFGALRLTTLPMAGQTPYLFSMTTSPIFYSHKSRTQLFRTSTTYQSKAHALAIFYQAATLKQSQKIQEYGASFGSTFKALTGSFSI